MSASDVDDTQPAYAEYRDARAGDPLVIRSSMNKAREHPRDEPFIGRIHLIRNGAGNPTHLSAAHGTLGI